MSVGRVMYRAYKFGAVASLAADGPSIRPFPVMTGRTCARPPSDRFRVNRPLGVTKTVRTAT